uniref:Odorant receptor 131-2-like n=1 Tax=Myripristis murdjan TaxID=586833 RepID=A0A667WNH4_9TELE
MNNTTGANLLVLFQKPVKVVFSLIPCLFFLYVNGVMLFTLMRKPLFQESARYILFGHLLLTDSLHLTMSIVVYLFAVTNVKMNSFVCAVVISLSRTITHISPLNLAVMSLERYAAICFPLRHAEIATNRRTRIAVAAVWTLGSLDSLIKLSVFVILEKKALNLQTFCSAYSLPQRGIYEMLNQTFTIMYFLLVGIIIIYTYIATIVAARSASSKSSTASKAHKTVLMHLLQLCLYLVSTTFNMINTTVYWNMMPVVRRQVRYVLFIVLIIFPRCLSPLIYGLRDQSFKHYFKYYFSFGLRNPVKPFDK